ncbi:MAG: hypothetical protein AAFY15_16035 [Cyanobacteria bacterium J06648_11]
MNAGNDEQLQQKLEELERREQALRLREMEMDITKPAVDADVEVVSEASPKLAGWAFRRWRRKFMMGVKFFGLVIAIVVAVRVAIQLAAAVMIIGIAWLAYQLFFAKDED